MPEIRISIGQRIYREKANSEIERNSEINIETGRLSMKVCIGLNSLAIEFMG
jgi:hypothetical protein